MWVQDMTPEEIEDIALLKQSKLLKPYAKFLIILCKYSSNKPHYTNILKEVVGGSYIIYAKEGVLDGLVMYKRGRPPKLTSKGEELCTVLVGCWENLKEKQKEKKERG